MRLWLLLLLILTIPVLLPLFNPGFFPTQDTIYIARVYQMNEALKDGQFPVRWVGGLRYGEPTFNFYAPLPYYAGVLVKGIGSAINPGFSLLLTVKVLIALGFVLSSLAMFWFVRSIVGNMGGLLSAALYLYAPYHSVDVYVRGALSESWALIFFPLIFLAAHKLSQRVNLTRVIWLVLSLTGLFLTHNVMTMLFAPFIVAWMIYLVWISHNPKLAVWFTAAVIWAIGLSASFLLPAFFEKEFVQSIFLTGGYYDFRGHFVSIAQFFTLFWGYGASLWGIDDGMSFQLGLVHWLVLLITLVVTLVVKGHQSLKVLTLTLTGLFVLSLFMQHNRSTPFWLIFPILGYAQFPWRFLGISIFLVSVTSGLLPKLLEGFHQRWQVATLLFLVAAVLVNVGYFRPEKYFWEQTDQDYISAALLSRNDKLPKDYLPIWVKVLSSDKLTEPRAVSGQIKASGFIKNSHQAQFQVSVFQDSKIEVPVTYFPGWQIATNDQRIEQLEPTPLGLIHFQLPRGEYMVKLKFADTPIRTAGNTITLISLAALGISLLIMKRRLLS